MTYEQAMRAAREASERGDIAALVFWLRAAREREESAS